jgi:hypothetical protein
MLKTVAATALLLASACGPSAAESLYEYYTTATQETLRTETHSMGRQLAKVFDENAVARRQQQIDFSEYVSNLKKAVLYAGKLATYSEYEKDLRFARDNEIFKGLPEDNASVPAMASDDDQKQFAQKKYTRMTKNVQEEIDTYQDLIQVALDACEMLAGNDLSGMLENLEFRDKLNEYQHSKDFQQFVGKRPQLARKWPDLEQRLARQLDLWQAPLPAPDDPIINRKITGAIAHATVVHSAKW